MFSPKNSVVKRYQSTLSHPFARHGGQAKMVEFVGKNKKVLDVGCASGYLAEQFKRNGCYVVGIEIDEEAAKMAAEYCDEVITGDVERVEIPVAENFFDIIVYGDILEHLKRPDLVLVKFRKYLSGDGFAVAAIPNVAYAPTRLRILAGKFDYKEYGHLDKTHLRFFTLKTAKELLVTSGYNVVKVDYTGPASILKILPTWLAMKFIIIAKKSSSEVLAHDFAGIGNENV